MAKGDEERDSIDSLARRRLRELRTERGLTLEQVGAAANIDASTLSRLESGKRRLALDHVPALAEALGVTADDLLGTRAAAPDPRVRGASRRTGDGLTLWSLTHHEGSGGLRAYKVRVSPKRNKPPEELPVHEGHDWIYVLSGRLRLLLGEQDLEIEAGEAVEFSTWTPHWFGAFDHAVEMILIIGPQGERIHLHA